MAAVDFSDIEQDAPAKGGGGVVSFDDIVDDEGGDTIRVPSLMERAKVRVQDFAPDLLSTEEIYDGRKRGALPNAWDEAVKPFVNLPRVTSEDVSPRAAAALLSPAGSALTQRVTGDKDAPQKIVAGAERGLAGIAEGFASPLGVATLGIGALPRVAARLVSGGFAAHMASGTPQLARDFGTAVGEGDLQKTIESGIGLGANSLFVAGAGTHAIRPKSPVVADIEKIAGETNETNETIPKAEVEPLKPKEPVADVFDEVAAQPVAPAEPAPVPVEQKVEAPVEQPEIAAEAPAEPVVKTPKNPIEIVNTAPKVKVSAPDGSTTIRATDSKGRVSTQPASAFKGANPLKGADIVKLEAGTIDRAGKFKAMEGPISVGPGAASPGDVPMAPQERQLIEAIEKIPASTGSGERVKLADQMADAMSTGKDAMSKWWLRTKAGAEQYKRLLLGAPLLEDNFWSTKKDWQANRQVNAGVAKEVIELGVKNHPNQLDRQAMGKYAEALMFDDPEGMLNQWAEKSKLHGDRAQYEKALNLTDDQKTAARTAIQYFEAKGKELQDAGMLNSLIEDYAGQHMVDRSGMGSPAMNQLRADLVRGTFNTNFKYAMRRVFETEADLEQAGYRLKTTDIFDKLANYGKTAQDVLADRAAVKAWMAGETTEGKPMFATGQHRIPLEGTEARPNASLLVNPKVRPDPKWTDPKTKAETDISGEYVRIDHPAFRKWQWAETTPDGKQIMVQGDVWAHKSIADELKNTFGRSHLYDVPGIDTATRVNAQLKGLKLVGLFHQVKTSTHALTHLVNPVGQPKINPHDPFTYEAMRSGLQLFNTGGAELFSEGLATSSILHKTPGIGPILRQYQDYLFHDYIPRIKLATYRAALERNVDRYGKKLSDGEIKQITATQVNSAYGELNWKLLGVNPTFHHALRLTLLAPDFQAAQHGFIAQMFTKTGGENRMAAAIMIGGVYTAARILNKIFDDDFHFEPRRAFGVVIGGREYGFRTIASDVQRMFTDTSQFVYHRLSPIASSAVELLTKKDAMGRLESGKQAVKNVAMRAVPIPVTPRDDITFKESALSGTLGYYGKRASIISDVKKNAGDWRKKNFPKAEDEEVIQYPISKYGSLRHALEDNRMDDAQEAVNKLLTDGVRPDQISKAMAPGKPFTGSRKVEGQWRKSLKAEDQKRLEKARATEREMFARYKRLKLRR